MAELNAEQKAAVECTDRKIVCIAGAGAGKTKTLVSRLIHQVVGGADATHMLVLTFTNAAAQEMKARYIAAAPEFDVPTFGTFHSFCYSLLVNPDIRNALGYTDVPAVATPEDIKFCNSQAKLITRPKLLESELSGDGEGLPSSKKRDYETFKRCRDKLLRQRGLITFDMMCYDIGQLFINDEACIQPIKRRYEYIYLDEFQDTDAKQLAFAEAFTNADLFVVGDAKQNLYSFRGTTNKIIKSLAESDEWTTIKMYKNYRCTEEICEFANKIHKSWGDSPYNLAIHSDKHDPDSVHFMPASEAYEVAPLYLLEITQNSDKESIAFLVRTNAEVSSLVDKCKTVGVKYHTNSSADWRASMLLALQDEQYAITWLPSILNATKYNNYLRACILNPEYKTIMGLQHFTSEDEAFAERYGIYLTLKTLLDTNISVFQKYKSITEKLDLPFDVADTPDTVEGIFELLNSKLGNATTDEGVYIGTIHSSKGLEYDTVHLFGVGGSSFQISDEDSKNIFYVGCTRAKNNLYIYSDKYRKDDEDVSSSTAV